MTKRIAAMAGAAVAVIAVVAFLALRGDDEPERVRVVELEVDARIPVGQSPQAVAVTDGRVYVANFGGASVSAIDSSTREVVDEFQVAALPAAMVATTDGRLWIGFAEGQYIAQFSGDGSVVGRALKVGSSPQGLAVAGENLWVAALNAGTVARVDLENGTVGLRPTRIGSDFPSAVAVGFGSVWVTDVVENVVLRLDPRNLSRVEEIEVGDSPTAVTVGHGSVWVANFRAGTVSRIDPSSNKVTSEISVGKGIGGISAGGDYVWVTTHKRGSVVVLDPALDGVAGLARVGSRPQGVVADGTGAWVVVQGDNELIRIEPRGSG